MRFTNEQRQRAAALYVQGVSVRKICAEIGCRQETLYQWLDAAKVPRRSMGPARAEAAAPVQAETAAPTGANQAGETYVEEVPDQAIVWTPPAPEPVGGNAPAERAAGRSTGASRRAQPERASQRATAPVQAEPAGAGEPGAVDPTYCPSCGKEQGAFDPGHPKPGTWYECDHCRRPFQVVE